MARENPLENHFNKIEIKKPVDLIIEQIRDLIHTGALNPGDRLPSEKVLEERFGVNRYVVRAALHKMQIYGILNIVPQSGTYVASIGVKALEGMITNVLKLQRSDYESLADTRSVLEIHAAELAAVRTTEDELQELEARLEDLRAQVEAGKRGLDEDYVLHLKIAELSKSAVLISLISMIVPNCLNYSSSVQPDISNFRRAQSEHEAIVAGIREHSPEKAAAAMREHMINNFQSTKELMSGNGSNEATRS